MSCVPHFQLSTPLEFQVNHIRRGTFLFWYMFILRDIILLVSYINQSGAINNVFIGVGVLLGLVWSCGYAVQGRFEPGFWLSLIHI